MAECPYTMKSEQISTNDGIKFSAIFIKLDAKHAI